MLLKYCSSGVGSHGKDSGWTKRFAFCLGGRATFLEQSGLKLLSFYWSNLGTGEQVGQCRVSVSIKHYVGAKSEFGTRIFEINRHNFAWSLKSGVIISSQSIAVDGCSSSKSLIQISMKFNEGSSSGRTGSSKTSSQSRDCEEVFESVFFQMRGLSG